MDRFDVLLIAVAVLAAALVGVIVWVAAKAKTGTKMRSVTRLLFVTTQVAALGWVCVSYIIAFYATVRLGQPFPVTDLSGQAELFIRPRSTRTGPRLRSRMLSIWSTPSSRTEAASLSA